MALQILNNHPLPVKDDKRFIEGNKRAYRCARELLRKNEDRSLNSEEIMELLCIGNAIDDIIGDEYYAEPGARVHILRYDKDTSGDPLDIEILRAGVIHKLKNIDPAITTTPKISPEMERRIEFIAHHIQTRIRAEAIYFPPITAK
ncbi:hypothetical protein HY483_04055 [Candidatus Woesearchaeota archaeon]|nr:hypothetical protein [Candidatus Woesearchaeota archaeon]